MKVDAAIKHSAEKRTLRIREIGRRIRSRVGLAGTWNSAWWKKRRWMVAGEASEARQGVLARSLDGHLELELFSE